MLHIRKHNRYTRIDKMSSYCKESYQFSPSADNIRDQKRKKFSRGVMLQCAHLGAVGTLEKSMLKLGF